MPRKPAKPKVAATVVAKTAVTETVPPALPPGERVELPDNPSQPKPPTLTRAERLAAFNKKWCDGQGIAFFQKLPRQDLLDMGVPHDELRAAGLLTEKNAASSDPTAKFPLEVSQREMAKIISDQFETDVTHDTLSKIRLAHKKDGSNSWVKQCVGTNNRWKPEITLRLWAENMGGKKDYENDAELDREHKRDRNRITRMEREEMERVTSGRWMLVEFFMFWCEKFGMKLINAARDYLEKDCKAMDERMVVKYVADPVQQQAMLAELRSGRITVFEDVQAELVKSIGTFAAECREQSEVKKAELKVKLI